MNLRAILLEFLNTVDAGYIDRLGVVMLFRQ
jgi:hypothetical protein